MSTNIAYAALKLENQLCFPLYACSRKVVSLYSPYLKTLGLTYTQYITLLVLWDKQSVTIRELSDALYLDTGTLSPLLQRLQENGLIERSRSVRDERYVHITPTEKGWALRDQALIIPEKISKKLKISGKNAQALYQILYGLLEYL